MFKSKGILFGWQMALAAHGFLALASDRFKVEHWMAAQATAAALVAQKSHKEGKLELATLEKADAPVA